MSGKGSRHHRGSSGTSQSSRGKRGGGHKKPAQETPQSSNQSEESIGISGTNPTMAGESMPPAQRQVGIPPAGKMLLPPLHRNFPPSTTSKGEKSRTSHACERCRKSKSKCSGTQPCEKCRNERKECIYGDGKRDKEKKDLQRTEVENQYLRAHIQRLGDKLTSVVAITKEIPSKEADEIVKLINEYKDLESENESDIVDSQLPPPHDADDSSDGEDLVGAEVGSTGSLDVVNEDTDQNEKSRSAGFFGKSSAVTWIQRAKREAGIHFREEADGHNPGGPKRNPYADSSYAAEESDLPMLDEDNNPFDWPPDGLARPLVDSFFANVHPAFPVVSQDNFMRFFNDFPLASYEQVTEEQESFLRTANIIFAISSKRAHMSIPQWDGDVRDHMVYYDRARRLGMDHRTLHKDPEISHTACLVLHGLYLLITDQLNRAWTITGVAIRHSMALGLHVRNVSTDISDAEKELRIRLWWSTYSLERFLNGILGRPSSISDRDIGTPMPSSGDDRRSSPEQEPQRKRSRSSDRTKGSPKKRKGNVAVVLTPGVSSESSRVGSMTIFSPTGSPPSTAYRFPLYRLSLTPAGHFIYRTQLSIISHEILSQLYCAALIRVKWSEVQDTIRRLDIQMQTWKETLNEVFVYESKKTTPIDGFDDMRKGLELFYNSSRMTLFRPTLCRIEGRIVNESQRSKEFNAQAVANCVDAAKNIIKLLPPISDPTKIYEIVPWWNTIHYIIEAASVLMLELAYRAEHVPKLAIQLVEDSKLAVRWLAALSDQSVAARKGWEIFNGLLRQVAPMVNGDVSDMPSSAPIPESWKSNRHRTGLYDSSNFSQEADFYMPVSQSFANVGQSWMDATALTMAPPNPTSQYAAAPINLTAGHSGSTGTLAEDLRPMQRFAGAMHNFGMAGHMLSRYDEFGPWHNPYYGVHGEDGGGGAHGDYEHEEVRMQNLQLDSSHSTHAQGSFSGGNGGSNMGAGSEHGREGDMGHAGQIGRASYTSTAGTHPGAYATTRSGGVSGQDWPSQGGGDGGDQGHGYSRG